MVPDVIPTWMEPISYSPYPSSVSTSAHRVALSLEPLIRSTRHRYRVYAISSEKLAYTVDTKALQIRSHDAFMIDHLPPKSMQPIYAKHWECRDETNSIHLVTESAGDARWNGCAVLCARRSHYDIVGMLLSTQGFQGQMEIVPADLCRFVWSTPHPQAMYTCYSYVFPSLVYQPHSENTCYVDVYGVLPISFRHVDKQAEMGYDVHLSYGDPPKQVWITGGMTRELACLSLEPFVECPPFLCRRLENRVWCTLDSMVPSDSPFQVSHPNPILVSIHPEGFAPSTYPLTFDSLVSYLAALPKNDSLHCRLEWMDTRVSYITLLPLTEQNGGKLLGPYARIWNDSWMSSSIPHPKKPCEQEQQMEEEMGSCEDPCEYLERVDSPIGFALAPPLLLTFPSAVETELDVDFLALPLSS